MCIRSKKECHICIVKNCKEREQTELKEIKKEQKVVEFKEEIQQKKYADNWTFGSIECYDLDGDCSRCSNQFTCASMKVPAMKKSVQLLLKTIGQPTEVTRRILGIGELEDVG